MKRSITTLALLFLTALAGAGCQEKDEITRYRVPPIDSVLSERGTYRILAAVIPQPEKTWLFTMSGEVEQVFQHKDDFLGFIQSLRFSRGQPTWSVPGGWKEEKGMDHRQIATFHVGPKDQLLRVKVEVGEGNLLAQVNRWRGELGLKSIGAGMLEHYCQDIKVGDISAKLVELTGPGKSAPAGPVLDYVVPEGWIKWKAPMSQTTFLIKEGEKQALVTVTPAGGELLDNLNRWRKQVNLGPLSKELWDKQIQNVEILGMKAPYVDIIGTESMEKKGDRILGAILEIKGQSLFFKMMGHGEVVGRNKAAFEAFLKSPSFKRPEKENE